MLQLAVDEKRSRRKASQETVESRSPLRRQSTHSVSAPPLVTSSPKPSRRIGMRSRGFKKILSREKDTNKDKEKEKEKENSNVILTPQVLAKGMNKKDTPHLHPSSIPLSVSILPSNDLYRSIHVESLLVAASGDIQNIPNHIPVPGDHMNIPPPPPSPSTNPSSATLSSQYPGNSSSNLVPLGDLLSESDSDCDRIQSSGNDSCSKASTMTRSGSSMSSIGQTKKVRLRTYFFTFFSVCFLPFPLLMRLHFER